MTCQLKRCSEYQCCQLKDNPFQGNRLCKGYEKYVNQDMILNKGNSWEITFTSANVQEKFLRQQDIFSDLTDKGRMIIQLYFFDRISTAEIAEQLYCSEQYVYNIIKRCRIYLSIIISKKPAKKGKKSDESENQDI
jgi:predicted DNA-binding protein YlxM (UPF0122 family)